MDLSKIMTISGKGGLYKVISETRTGMLAESITDGRKVPVFATDRSSMLEDISVFTTEGEMPLKEVLWKIFEHEGGKLSIDFKTDTDAVKKKFEEVLPEYDKDRVYFSDIKKIFSWYNLLLEKDMITKPEPPEEDKEASEKNNKSETEDIENKHGQQQEETGTGNPDDADGEPSDQ